MRIYICIYLYCIFDFDGVGWIFDSALKKYVYALYDLQLVEFTILGKIRTESLPEISFLL